MTTIRTLQLTFVNTLGYTQSLLIRKGEKSYGFVPYVFPDVWMVLEFLIFPISMVFHFLTLSNVLK